MRLIRQPQTLHNAPVQQVLIDNFIHIVGVVVGIPDGIGIHHGHRALATAVEAPAAIDPDLAWTQPSQRFQTPFGVRADGLGIVLGATLRTIFAPVHANKEVALVVTHADNLAGGSLTAENLAQRVLDGK